jgi:hypothetical protein
VNVAVPDSTFVVTLSYNEQTQMYEPDCTLEEIQAADSAGKTIVLMGDSMQDYEADGYYGMGSFWYRVVRRLYSPMDAQVVTNYQYDSRGVTVLDSYTYIIPSGTKSITQNGTGIDVTNYASVDVSVSGGGSNLQAKTNITPTESS